jgi:hypothetical protein
MNKLSAAAQQIEDDIARRRASYFSRTGTHGEEFLFSTDAGSSTSSAASKVVTIKSAAEACGLSEQDMRDRVAGRCKLKVIDGELSATQGDLQTIANAGVIPKPSDVVKAKERTAAADKPATDSVVDRRTQQMADALAIDVSPVTPAEPIEQQALAVTAKRVRVVVSASRVDGRSDRPPDSCALSESSAAGGFELDQWPRP